MKFHRFTGFFPIRFFPIGTRFFLQGLPDANGSFRGVARLRVAGGMVMGNPMISGLSHVSLTITFYSGLMG